MGLGDRIVELLVGSAILTFWLIADGITVWKNFLTEQNIDMPLGEGGIIFSGFIIVGLSGMIGAYVILWSIKRRRGVV